MLRAGDRAANVLLLRNIISLSGPSDRPEVSTAELMSLIASRLLDTNDGGAGKGKGNDSGDTTSVGGEQLLPPDAAAEGNYSYDAAADAEAEAARRQNQEQNISDAMAVLPTLATAGFRVRVFLVLGLGFRIVSLSSIVLLSSIVCLSSIACLLSVACLLIHF